MANRKAAQRQLRRNLELSDAQIAAFIGKLRTFLERSLVDILDGLDEDDIRAEEAASVLGSLMSSLDRAGLRDELAEITAIYGKDIEYIEQAFREAGAARRVFSEVDLDTVQTLIDFDVSALQDNVGAYVSDIRSAVMRTVMSGERPDLKTLVREFTDRAIRNAETELRTGLSAFKRTLTLSKADEVGFEWFLYVGPDDEVTRPFCQERVGKAFSIEQIREWDNEQGLPAEIYLGGYNCRHDLRPISEEEARASGAAD